MTDFANLVLGIDSTQVKAGTAELDRMAAAGAKTEQATKGVEREWVKASSAAGKLRLEQMSASLAADKLAREQAKAGRAASEMAREAQAAAAGLGRTTASMGAQRAGAQQLAFQLGDVATQFSLGARPMQIFAAQGTQIVGALSLMRGTAGGLVGFLAGPWGIAITAAATVLGTLITQLYATENAADGASGALQRLIDKRREERNERLEGVRSERELNALIKERATIQARIASQPVDALGNPLFSFKDQKRVSELNDLITEGRLAVNERKFEDRQRQLEREEGALKRIKEINEGVSKSSGERARSAKQSADAVTAEAKVLDTLLDRLLKPERDQAQRNSEFDLLAREIEKAEKAGAAALPRLMELEKALARLRGERITSGPIDLALEDPGSLLGTPAFSQFRKVAEEFAEGTVRGLNNVEEAARLANEPLREMIELLGRVGGAGGILGGLLGLLTGNDSAVGGILGELLRTQVGIRTDAGGKPFARTIGDELRDIFKLDGEFGKTMERLLGSAGTGVLAANALGFTGGASQFGSAIGGALAGELSDNVSKAIGGALGSAAGAILPVVGGLLGGALGSLLSSTPRGSATIGNLNGSLGVTGTRGNSRARIAAATDSANAIIGSLDALAAELGATLDPTRGSVSIGIRKGNFRVDTSGQGRTKTSRGAIDFGEDAEAAALFAIQDLIRDGVLVGLREGTERLLKEAADLETGIQKALKFEGVFQELRSITDPVGAALEALDKEFAQLRKIFAEAGASAAEYAQLEELLALKRQEAIDDGIQRELDKLSERNDLEVELLRLLGREEEALAQARQFELATTEAALRPLKEMIITLQDANAVIAQFEPLADDLRAFRNELLGSGSTDSFAFLTQRFRDTAAGAANGDIDALASLRGVSSEFLEAARDNASSAIEYQRAVGEVLGAVDSGIFAADAQVEYAKLQIEAIDANRDAVLQGFSLQSTQLAAISEKVTSLERMWTRYDGDGLTVKADQDTPIFVKTAPGDTVATA